jgi:5'-phosphate synthase pdxT subunit
MGLIGTATTTTTAATTTNTMNLWDALKDFIIVQNKPCWGTCAGMILLAERCVGASAVIQNGQSLIGGMDILVCRNYFGSQVSSFEMATPPPPLPLTTARQPSVDRQEDQSTSSSSSSSSYPGVFIRAPAILSAGPDVTVLGKVVATPCRQAAVVLQELEQKIADGETVVQMGVVDALDRKSSQEITYRVVVKPNVGATMDGPATDSRSGDTSTMEEEKKESNTIQDTECRIELPGAADGSNAREVICAVRRNNLLCTAFHPELTNDYRWHQYFVQMVQDSKT